MKNAVYLFTAFTIVWALVYLYVLILFNRQRRLRRDIELLKEGLKKKARASEPSSEGISPKSSPM